MWRVARLLLVALAAVLAMAPASEAAAVTLPAGQAIASEVAQVAQPTPTPGPGDPAATNAPPGIPLGPAQTEADVQKSKRKLVVGVIAVVLLGIVVLGRRARKKKA